MEETLSSRIETVCLHNAERTLAHDAAGEPVSFGDFFQTVLSFGEKFHALGVTSGQVVSVLIPDPIASLIARLALLRMGAISGAIGKNDVEESSDILVDHWVVAGRASLSDTISIDATWLHPPTDRVRAVGNGYFLKSSSGTTGKAKFFATSDCTKLAQLTRSIRQRGAPSGPSFIGYGPGSNPATNAFLRNILSGVTSIFPVASASENIQRIVDFGVTDIYVSPYNFNALLDAARAHPQPVAFHVKRMIVGGGALLPETAKQAANIFGCKVFNSYGSSETGSISMVRADQIKARHGVVGLPHGDVELRFVDETGASIDPTTGGEVQVRTPSDCQTLDFPTFVPLHDEAGWLRTGDLGQLLPDGQLKLTGRKAEIINVGGVKRSPEYFESVAMGFPGLDWALAFPVPAPDGNHHVGIAIGAKVPPDVHAFGAFLSAELGARFPFYATIMDDQPMTAAGKPDRRALTELFITATKQSSS